MNTKSQWTRFASLYRFYDSVGLSLDTSCMFFPDGYLDSISDKLLAALDSMTALEKGSIANTTEKRMVGHYWLRDSSLAPSIEIKDDIDRSIQRVRDFSHKVRQGIVTASNGMPFTQAVIIGIGGSALGPQLLYDVFFPTHEERKEEGLRNLKLFFCDNTDPDGIKRLFDQIAPALCKTLFIVISKSGGTIETRNGMLEFEHFCVQNDLDLASRAVAITCPGSKLDQIAKTNWLDVFYIWDWVGGRTSIFSSVGLLPASLHGVKIDNFLRGAATMDIATRNTKIDENPAVLLTAMWYYAAIKNNKSNMVVLPYRDRLILFSRYLQQLVMESLGKKENLLGKDVFQGLTVYGNKGSTDQHAYIQQLRDGLLNFFVLFIEVLDDGDVSNIEVEKGVTTGDYLQGFYLGTRDALRESGRESISITLGNLDEVRFGALLALFERTVGLYAAVIEVNAYDQPGVEAGKKAASKVISMSARVLDFLMANRGQGYKVEDIASNIDAHSDCELVFKILERLSSNPIKGVEKKLFASGDKYKPDMVMYSA